MKEIKYPSLAVLAACLAPGIALGLLLNPMVWHGHDLTSAHWLDVAHKVCTGIGGLGTIVTLIIVMRQFQLLRSQSELVQKNIIASMDAQLYARLDSFNRFVFEHFQEYDLLDSAYQPKDPSPQRSKLHRMCELGFAFFEEIHTHHRRLKMLETEDWDKWEQNMIHFFKKPYVNGYWNTVSERYARSFQLPVGELTGKINLANAKS